MTDKVEALEALCDGAADLTEAVGRIDRIFSEISEGRHIVLSSIHRAKGLEWDRVFMLENTLKETSVEERNLRYVGVTRAREHLVLVQG